MIAISWIILICSLGAAAAIGWMIGAIIYDAQEIKRIKKALAEKEKEEKNKYKVL